MANIFCEQARPSPNTRIAALPVGRFFIDKYRSAAAERGYRSVALQLRKQGVSLRVARLILFGKD